MNGWLDLRIITQPYSELYWGYFRRLVFGNSLTKHNKLSSFSYSVLIFVLPLSHIPPCYHTKHPDFPRLFEPRGIIHEHTIMRLRRCGHTPVATIIALRSEIINLKFLVFICLFPK